MEMLKPKPRTDKARHTDKKEVDKKKAKKDAKNTTDVHSGEGAYGVAANEVCTLHRETGKCRDGANCTRKHVTTTGLCQNEGYLTDGFCGKWYTCHGEHPWNNEKHGDKREALQKYKEMRKM